MARKKQKSNAAVLVALGLTAFGIYQFGIVGNQAIGKNTSYHASPVTTLLPSSASEPLDKPRFVNVASLNVRHTPSLSGPLIMALSRGTALKVLDREGAWLLVDLGPTLEGWVAESLTTTQGPKPDYLPPARLSGLEQFFRN